MWEVVQESFYCFVSKWKKYDRNKLYLKKNKEVVIIFSIFPYNWLGFQPLPSVWICLAKKELSKTQQTRLYLTNGQDQNLQSFIGTEQEVQAAQNLILLQSCEGSFAVNGSAIFSPIDLGEVRQDFLT